MLYSSAVGKKGRVCNTGENGEDMHCMALWRRTCTTDFMLALRELMVTYREGQCLCGDTESIYSIIGCQERNCGIA